MLIGPVTAQLDPLGELDARGAAGRLAAWSLPAALLGASLGLSFLAAQCDFLRRLTPGDRWRAEVAVLVLAAAGAQAFLAVGASVAPSVAPSVANGPEARAGGVVSASWAAGCLLTDLHVAAIGSLVLRWPVSAGARIAGVWALLWGLPGLLGTGGAMGLLDAGRPVRDLLAISDSPRQWATGVAMIAALLVASALVLVARHAPAPR